MTRRWGLLALVFLGILISYVDRGNLSIAAAAMMHEFKMPPASMGVLLSAFFWTYAICQIPAGLIVDRFGIRVVYAGAFLLWSLASAGVALSRGPSDVFALRLVLGLAEASGPLASLAFIRQGFKGSEQGLPVSIYIAGQTIGPACGSLLGSMLLADFGWRTLFAVTGLGALLWVPGWTYFAPRRWADITTSAAVPNPIRWPWCAMFCSTPVWAMSACVIFFSYYWYFLLTWMPSYLTMARGYSTIGMGKILSVPLFAMAVVNVLAGFLADRIVTMRRSVFDVRLWFASLGLLGASSILLLNVLPGRASVLPILVISICSLGLASSNFWAIAQYTSPSRMVGRAIGYLNTLSQIGGVIAPLVTGWSLGPQRDFRPAILIAGLCPIVSAGLLIMAGPKKLNQLKMELDDASA
jgi:ACS family D-galactonate transporter-like MFS transporter